MKKWCGARLENSAVKENTEIHFSAVLETAYDKLSIALFLIKSGAKIKATYNLSKI